MKGDNIKKRIMANLYCYFSSDVFDKTPIIEQIFKEVKDFDTYIRTFGNQCAWTDRICENVVKMGEGLKVHTHPKFPDIYNQKDYDINIAKLKSLIFK